MIQRLLPGLASRWRALCLRLRGARLEGPVWLRRIEVPRQASRIRLAAGVALDRDVSLVVSGSPSAPPCLSIGPRTYVNRSTMLDACQGITIGADVMIGPFCYITDHDHARDAEGRPAGGALDARPVVIGDRVWIGAHACILKGVTIGSGATVAAGAVVTHDVPAGATVAGIPARPLRAS